MAYSMRDIYGGAFTPSTRDNTAPEAEEQQALANETTTAPKIVQNKTGIWTWLGIIVLFIVLYHIGGK